MINGIQFYYIVNVKLWLGVVLLDIDRRRVKEIYKDQDTRVITSGYDDIIENQYCTEKKENVDITRMYREYNIPGFQPRILYTCNKSEKVIKKHEDGEEYTTCIDGTRCQYKCICYNCLAACGKETKWQDNNMGSNKEASNANSFNELDMNNTSNQKTTNMCVDMLDIIIGHHGYEYFDLDLENAQIGMENYKTIKNKMLLDEQLSDEENQILYNAVQKTRYYFNSTIDRMRNSEGFVNEFNKFDTYYKIYLLTYYKKELKDPQNNFPGSSSGGCYIATAVYGDYDSPEVMVLRRFRDEVLSKNIMGNVFIKVYYTLSPPIAKHLKNTKIINLLVKSILNKIVICLERSL